eukprot:1511734-Amphidinium_carterae.1
MPVGYLLLRGLQCGLTYPRQRVPLLTIEAVNFVHGPSKTAHLMKYVVCFCSCAVVSFIHRLDWSASDGRQKTSHRMIEALIKSTPTSLWSLVLCHGFSCVVYWFIARLFSTATSFPACYLPLHLWDKAEVCFP